MKPIKFVSADEAVKVVKSGDHVHFSSVSAYPVILGEALARRGDTGELKDVRIHHLHTEGDAPYTHEKYNGVFFTQSFFVGANVRKDTQSGWADYIPVFQYWKEHDILQHLDISLTAGTTGIGIDVASPIGEYVQVRAGYEIMPRFNKSMNFDLTIGGKPARMYDPNGNRIETTFDRLKDMLYDFTGYDIDDHIEMIAVGMMATIELVDATM